MRINHIHLRVRDPERSARFWTEAFELQRARRRRLQGVLFLRDDADLDLALAPGEPFADPHFHLGFRLDAPERVRRVHDRLSRDGAEITQPLTDEPDMIWFRCRDPDGYGIEVYWEPSPGELRD